jgi:alpha-tubulin suppressor-like RCC1 family protein
MAHRPRPVQAIGQMGSPVEVQQLVSAGFSNCGIRTTGEVTCWGVIGNIGGVPRDVPDISSARHVAMSHPNYVCAAQADGLVKCWNGSGSATTIAGMTGATRVAAGDNFGCAIKSDQSLWCWGNNAYGQLGDNTTMNRVGAAVLSGLTGVVDVVAGWHHVCARRSNGDVLCWGRNTYGQLGDGSTTERRTPTAVAAWRNATRMAAGVGTTCAILSGQVHCAGYNAFGQLGDNSTVNRSTPVRAGSLSTAIEVAVNEAHTCAILRDAMMNYSVRCWGRDTHGELGLGHEVEVSPRAVASLTDATAITAGSTHICALRRTGRVVCWGGIHGNAYGQFGDGTRSASSDIAPRPAFSEVTGITNATAISAGSLFTCALLADRTVRCWGYNGYGQLGDGTTTDSPVPVTVAGLSNVAEISAGSHHVCARLTTGQVRCWGYNFFGQLCNGTVLNSSSPTVAMGVSNAAQLSLGSLHTCMRLTTGRVVCCGRNIEYQLGTGVTTNSYVPVELTDAMGSTLMTPVPLTNVEQISCRLGSVCAARRMGGQVVAWGSSVGTRATSWGTIADWRGQDFHDTTCQLLGTNVHCGVGNEWGLAGNGMPYVTTYTGLRPDTARSASQVVGGQTYAAVERVRSIQNICALRVGGSVDCWGYVSGGFLNYTGLNHLVLTPSAGTVPLP